MVTYFTTDVRCVSCKTIERLTRETLERDFAETMKNGQLRFQTINIDRAENKHYINEYDLSFKTVVVAGASQNANTDWEKLDEVWRLLNAPADFAAYVNAAVAQKLDARALVPSGLRSARRFGLASLPRSAPARSPPMSLRLRCWPAG